MAFSQNGEGESESSGIRVGADSLSNGSLGGAVLAEKAARGPVEISYYFSAQCPFCAKFEPQLQSLIQQLGEDDVAVTCVDVTPTERVGKDRL